MRKKSPKSKKRSVKKQEQKYAPPPTWEETIQQGGGWILIALMLPFLLGVGWLFFTRDIHELRGKLFANSRSWAVTTGSITQSELVQPSRRSRRWIHEKITYRYVVNSRVYSGQRVTFWSLHAAPGAYHSAQNRVARYPVGRIVPVFYLPENPAYCVLEPNEKEYLSVVLYSCLMLMLFGGFAAGLIGNYKYLWRKKLRD